MRMIEPYGSLKPSGNGLDAIKRKAASLFQVGTDAASGSGDVAAGGGGQH